MHCEHRNPMFEQNLSSTLFYTLCSFAPDNTMRFEKVRV